MQLTLAALEARNFQAAPSLESLDAVSELRTADECVDINHMPIVNVKRLPSADSQGVEECWGLTQGDLTNRNMDQWMVDTKKHTSIDVGPPSYKLVYKPHEYYSYKYHKP